MFRERAGERATHASVHAARRPPSRGRGRAVLRWAHRLLGLVVGTVLVVSGLTGSALVFRQEIDRALNPHLLTVAPTASRAPLQPILDAVRRGHPEATPTRIRMPQRPEDAYEFWLGTAPDKYVYADPYRGTLLGSRRPTEFITGWLFLAHSHLLAGERGKRVAGTAALCLVLLSLTGLVLWWPRDAPWRSWASWRVALTITRPQGAKRLTYDVHRALGFYASMFLLVAGISGASLAFPGSFERVAHLLAGTTSVSVGSSVAAPVAGTAALPLDALLGIAERAQPGGVATYVYLPGTPGQAFRVRQRLAGEAHPTGKSFVHVDPVTGRVLAVEDGQRAPRGARLYSMLYPLHIGVLGGLATRLLVLLVGLSLPVLALSGALVWWQRGRGARS